MPSCGRDHANDGLTAGVNVNMLDRDLLLTFSSVMIESVEKASESSRELVGLV